MHYRCCLHKTIVRRTLFLAVLLLFASIDRLARHLIWPTTIPLSPRSVELIAGLCTTRGVLAVWLVTRIGVWNSIHGLVRVVGYVVAYVCGDLLSRSLDQYLNGSIGKYGIFGSFFAPFPTVMYDLLALSTLAVMLYLPLSLMSLRLVESSQTVPGNLSLSIPRIAGFTTAAALLSCCVATLTNEALPTTALTGMTRGEAFSYWLRIGFLNALPATASATVLLFCISKRVGWWWLLAYGFGALTQIGAKELVMAIRYRIEPPSPLTALTGIRGFRPSWLFQTGQVTTVFMACLVATWLGVEIHNWRSRNASRRGCADADGAA